MTTTTDTAYSATGKSYMMGGSPWFYTNLPGYGKSWAWRGDSLWYDRWQQVLDILPEFAEIVTWNDFGESHYIGPIVESGIPQDPDTDARPYVDGMDHTAWLETLEWQIVAYKHAFDPIAYPAPSVKEDKIIYWYRLSPASAGLTSATGNNCPSPTNKFPYQECAPIGEVMEDGIFAIALLTAPGSVSIAIGGGAVQTLEGLQAGINFLSRPFGGEVGVVSVSSSSGVKGSGKEILAQPVGGETNFNAWLGALGLVVRRRCEEEARVNANRFIMHNFSTSQECFTSHLRCCTLRPCAALKKPYCSVSQGHSHHRSIVKDLSPAQPEQVTAAERADLQTNQPHADLPSIEIFSAPGPLPASLQRACPQYRLVTDPASQVLYARVSLTLTSCAAAPACVFSIYRAVRAVRLSPMHGISRWPRGERPILADQYVRRARFGNSGRCWDGMSTSMTPDGTPVREAYVLSSTCEGRAGYRCGRAIGYTSKYLPLAGIALAASRSRYPAP